MNQLVTIVGASGNIGGALASSLLEKRIKVRAVGRQADRLSALRDRGAEICVGSVGDTNFLAKAFLGAQAVFVMIPPNFQSDDYRAEQKRMGYSLASALEKAEVKQAVALSSLGANLPSGTGPIAGLHEFEQRLHSIAGLSLIILRPAFFMENHLGSIPMIHQAGINGGLIHGDLPLPMVATQDIALVAAGFLEIPTQESVMIREILGPRDYTMQEATAILGAAIGKPGLPYVEFGEENFLQGLTEAGFSVSVANGYVEMSQAFNEGRIQNVVRRQASNSTPTSLEAFAQQVFAPAYSAQIPLQARGTSA
jgi:uncharacterized protein YbjT (DUF2867 family)